MLVLRSKTIVILILNYNELHDTHGGHADSADSLDDYSSPNSMKECTFVNNIELLKMRHQFVSNTVTDLNYLYNIQLAISLSILLLMTLIDIYDVMSMDFKSTKTKIQQYAWLVQYSFRFCMIVGTNDKCYYKTGNSCLIQKKTVLKILYIGI